MGVGEGVVEKKGLKSGEVRAEDRGFLVMIIQKAEERVQEVYLGQKGSTEREGLGSGGSILSTVVQGKAVYVPFAHSVFAL